MIRRATPADAEAIFHLERSVPGAAHWPLAEYTQILQADPAAALQRTVLVAEDQSQLTGFIILKRLQGEGHAEIENIAVVADHQRQGIGRALCEAALEAGNTPVELEVRAGNTAALGLYIQMGFRQTGRRRGYYANPPDDAILLRRP